MTDANFSAQVAQSRLPVLLDLWAPWCGPCRAMAPVLDEVAAAMAGRVLVGKRNVDENPQTASRFQVNSIPTLIIFKEGREIQRLVGGQSKAALIQRLEQLL
ncbi:MAG: thioredoxin [Aureliella sp.]